jgi:hypothetical protein
LSRKSGWWERTRKACHETTYQNCKLASLPRFIDFGLRAAAALPEFSQLLRRLFALCWISQLLRQLPRCWIFSTVTAAVGFFAEFLSCYQLPALRRFSQLLRPRLLRFCADFINCYAKLPLHGFSQLLLTAVALLLDSQLLRRLLRFAGFSQLLRRLPA